MTFQVNLRGLFMAIITIVSLGNIKAQAPQIINYQAVVRDAAGEIVKNKAVNFRLSILDGSITGIPQYVETQSKTTNQFGLVTFGIGQGTTVSGSMSSVSWASLSKFLKVELDINGGNNFSLMSTSQFLSVPFALYAATSGSSGAASQWSNNSVGINYNAGSVGLGTASPSAQLHTLGSVRFQGLSLNNALTNILAADANGNLSWRDASTLVNVGGWLLTGNAVGANNFFGTTNLQNLRFYTNNTQKAVLTTDGNLGIGTATPTSKLAIETNFDGIFSSGPDGRIVVDLKNTSTSSASQTIAKLSAGNSGSFTILSHSSSTYTTSPDTDNGQMWSCGTGGLILRASPKNNTDADLGGIRFLTGWYPNATGSLERMKLDNKGNLGIGTSNPTSKLSIETNSDGSGTLDGRFAIDLKNTSTAPASQVVMKLASGSSGNYLNISQSASSYSIGPDADAGILFATGTGGLVLRASPKGSSDPDVGAIHFYTGWNSSNPNYTNERLRIEANGNVGIGTSTPKAKVEVANGDVYLTDPTKGIILKSPNGNCWRVTVDNTGNLVRTQITCPQ